MYMYTVTLCAGTCGVLSECICLQLPYALGLVVFYQNVYVYSYLMRWDLWCSIRMYMSTVTLCDGTCGVLSECICLQLPYAVGLVVFYQNVYVYSYLMRWDLWCSIRMHMSTVTLCAGTCGVLSECICLQLPYALGLVVFYQNVYVYSYLMRWDLWCSIRMYMSTVTLCAGTCGVLSECICLQLPYALGLVVFYQNAYVYSYLMRWDLWCSIRMYMSTVTLCAGTCGVLSECICLQLPYALGLVVFYQNVYVFSHSVQAATEARLHTQGHDQSAAEKRRKRKTTVVNVQ